MKREERGGDSPGKTARRCVVLLPGREARHRALPQKRGGDGEQAAAAWEG